MTSAVDGLSIAVRAKPRLAFIYGSREVIWPEIAGFLFAEKGVIRDILLRCERLVQNRLNCSLEKIGSTHQISQINAVEPLLTSVQIALTESWRERGIEPDVIAARSGGEFAAEYARGTLSLEDAIEVACRASYLMSSGAGAGRMLTIDLTLSETERLKLLSPVAFSVAADASDEATVVACETGAVSQLKKFLRTQQIGYHTLRFDIAPHGPVIDEWKTVLLKPVSAGMLAASRIPYYSAAADGPDRGSHYRSRLWDAVRQPAYMGRMLQNLLADGCNTFVEVGGKGSLAEMIDRRAAEMGTKAVVLPTMRIRESAHTVMSETETVLRRLGVLARPRANSARVSAG